MRYLLLALILPATAVVAQEIPTITAGTGGHPLLLTVANASTSSTLRHITVSAERLPAGVRIQPAERTLDSLMPGSERDVIFTLEAANAVRLTGPDTLLMSIRSAATGITTRTIVFRFVPPAEYALAEVYPNPFNPTAKCELRIAHWGVVRVVLYDLLGREVRVLTDGVMQPGVYTSTVDGAGLASGVYFLRMTATPADGSPGFVGVRKLALLK